MHASTLVCSHVLFVSALLLIVPVVCRYDFPLTAEEVRAAERAGVVTVSVAACLEPGNHPLIDAVEVYTRSPALALPLGAQPLPMYVFITYSRC
jgi:hypothetical protein